MFPIGTNCIILGFLELKSMRDRTRAHVLDGTYQIYPARRGCQYGMTRSWGRVAYRTESRRDGDSWGQMIFDVELMPNHPQLL